MSIIEAKNLTKTYGKARGITNLNLSVEEGDFFGFIGPNGAGKSTTIRTLLGFIRPTDGSATIFQQAIQSHRDSILSDIGYMPSEAMFYHGMQVQDILTLSAKLHKKDCRQESKELCHRLDLDVHKKIEELSLGNRKKVAIVCALQHRPKLYILDEPTSGLDPLMQKEFFRLLQERNEAGATIFLSSHVLSEIQKNCRHAAIIKEGKLIACDSVSNLTNTRTRKVSLHGITTLPDTIQGTSVQKDGDTINFLYSGDIKPLLEQLSPLPLQDVLITEPDLEEVLLHYYKEERS